MDRPFLQTPEWLEFQRYTGHKVWRLDDGFIKANIIRYDVRLGQNFLSIPYGPELNMDLAEDGIKNQVTDFIKTIAHIGQEEKSMFVKIEPMHDIATELLYRNGMKLRRSPVDLQPHATVVADLSQTEDELLDRLHHKHRYNINLAERKGVTIGTSGDIDTFWSLLQDTANRDGFRPHTRMYYHKLINFFAEKKGKIRTRLFFAYHGGDPIAATLMLEHEKTAYYLHGVSDRAHRALMAPHLLHWTLMKWYREAGFLWYDFWGIDSTKWPGVTRFKLGFGARHIEYPGAFDFVFKPVWRWLYHWAPR